MKKKPVKLSLNKETMRNLSECEAAKVVGGLWNITVGCNSNATRCGTLDICDSSPSCACDW